MTSCAEVLGRTTSIGSSSAILDVRVRAPTSREVGDKINLRMRDTIFIRSEKGAPHGFADQKLNYTKRGKMAVGFAKLAIFIAVSLHYVAAQGTSK